MDHLSDMLPSEAMQHPFAQMFFTFMREAKKDIKRMPDEFVMSLAKVIGEAFTWVATGELNEPPDWQDEVQELLADIDA